MILRMPSYYKKFKCTADKCSDNCCIGWEIDIDENSMNYYRNTEGEFGKRLRKNISEASVPHFILGKGKRCPFLNSNNLCEVFINLGEENLCSICNDHPRYFQWYYNIKEGGIALCCESAAEIILGENAPFSYYDEIMSYEECGEYDKEFYNYLFKIREKIILHMNNKSIPLKIRLNNILHYTFDLQEKYDNFDFEIGDIVHYNINLEKNNLNKILLFFNSLESLDEHKIFRETILNYENIISVSEEMLQDNPEIYDYLENAAVYFIWRHFLRSTFEEEFYSKIAFTVLSTLIIAVLFTLEYVKHSGISTKNCIKMAVYYSKEIEYSEENLNTIFDQFYENTDFSIENLEHALNILGF